MLAFRVCRDFSICYVWNLTLLICVGFARFARFEELGPLCEPLARADGRGGGGSHDTTRVWHDLTLSLIIEFHFILAPPINTSLNYRPTYLACLSKYDGSTLNVWLVGWSIYREHLQWVWYGWKLIVGRKGLVWVATLVAIVYRSISKPSFKTNMPVKGERLGFPWSIGVSRRSV